METVSIHKCMPHLLKPQHLPAFAAQPHDQLESGERRHVVRVAGGELFEYRLLAHVEERELVLRGIFYVFVARFGLFLELREFFTFSLRASAFSSNCARSSCERRSTAEGTPARRATSIPYERSDGASIIL